jgi:DNA-binding NtrC family response regulator
VCHKGVKLKRTIFYVDDEAACLEVFQTMFGYEYDVRTATSAAQARRMLLERSVNIIICDQNMPEISGTQFLAEVAKEYPQSYRIMLTGSMLVGEAIPEILSGIVQLFITKPWTEEEMRHALERAGFQADLNHLKNE